MNRKGYIDWVALILILFTVLIIGGFIAIIVGFSYYANHSPYYVSYENDGKEVIKIPASNDEEIMPHGSVREFHWEDNKLIITFEK